MKHFFAIFLAALCVATSYGQTIKALSYNTTNGVVVAGTNPVKFTNEIRFGQGDLQIDANGAIYWSGALRYEPETQTFHEQIEFDSATTASNTRVNLGLGALWLTNTNATNFRTAIGLGATNDVSFAIVRPTSKILWAPGEELSQTGWVSSEYSRSFAFDTGTIGGSWSFDDGIGVRGSIVISNSSATNGLLFVYRTNNEAFLGLANLIASNNTTLSNETLFRVGVAEATNRSAQFGFRTVRTNNGGEGFATFSVFGYNALMMIGPSDRSRTNTATNAGIEADIWTITPTNRVATLRDTNSGAFTLHQELGFSTNSLTTNAPANTTNVALWLRVWVGTNNYRLPLYQ